jgi:hypothetical protein
LAQGKTAAIAQFLAIGGGDFPAKIPLLFSHPLEAIAS